MIFEFVYGVVCFVVVIWKGFVLECGKYVFGLRGSVIMCWVYV